VGKHVRLHHQPRFQFQEPAAAVTPSSFHEIERAVVLGVPFLLDKAANSGVHNHHASRPEYGSHTAIRKPDIAIAKTRHCLLLHSGEVVDSFRVGGKEFRGIGDVRRAGAWIGRRAKDEIHGELVQVCVLRLKSGTVFKGLLKRSLIPAGDFEGAEVINGGEGIELMKAGYDIAVFDVRQTADVKDEIGAAAFGRQFIAGLFDLPIGKSERFSGLS
jgi:hypothetical protein